MESESKATCTSNLVHPLGIRKNFLIPQAPYWCLLTTPFVLFAQSLIASKPGDCYTIRKQKIRSTTWCALFAKFFV